MNAYKSSSELKGISKEHLFGHYGTVIGALLLVGIISMIANSIPSTLITASNIPQLIIYYLIGFVISLFLGIFQSGKAFLYLKLVCRQPVSAGDVFYGFKVYPDKAIILQFADSIVLYVSLAPVLVFYYLYLVNEQPVYMLLMSIFLVIGSVIITIVSLMLSQTFYLLQDFPQYSAKELLKMSCQIMKGHKARLFYIQISFIPLYLLGIFSFCIAFFWLVPYTDTVLTNFYMDLMKNRKQPEQETAESL